MNRMVVKSRVGTDGVLHLALPVGAEEAGNEIEVSVETVATKPGLTQAEWAAWVDSMAGAWQGEFERPPPGELQERDPL